MAIKEYAAKLIEQDATLKEIAEQKETLWVNPKFLPFEMTDAVCQLVVSDADIADAEARLERFAPFIRKCFPETECTNGIIESPLKPIPEMQKGLIEATGSPISGNLFLKMDSHLAVAGSVKARGGIYEVLKHAEDLAIAAGKLKVTDNYEKLCSDEMRAFFNQYTVPATWACPSASAAPPSASRSRCTCPPTPASGRKTCCAARVLKSLSMPTTTPRPWLRAASSPTPTP